MCYLVNKYPPEAAPNGDFEVGEVIEGDVPDMSQRVQMEPILSS